MFGITHTKKVKQQLDDTAAGRHKDEDADAAAIALDRIVDKGSDGYAMAKMKKHDGGRRFEGLPSWHL